MQRQFFRNNSYKKSRLNGLKKNSLILSLNFIILSFLDFFFVSFLSFSKEYSIAIYFISESQQTSSTSGHRFVTQAVLVEHPHYAVLPSQSLQEEHEANLAFANSIANYLSGLNEDEVSIQNFQMLRFLVLTYASILLRFFRRQ